MKNKPSGLRESDTLADSLQRADSLSSPEGTRHSGMMCERKDLRRIVLLSREYRKSTIRIERLEVTLKAYAKYATPIAMERDIRLLNDSA